MLYYNRGLQDTTRTAHWLWITQPTWSIKGRILTFLLLTLAIFSRKMQFSQILLKLLSWNFVDMVKMSFCICGICLNKDFVHSMKNNLIIVWNSHKWLLLPEHFSHFEALGEWDLKLCATNMCKIRQCVPWP